MTFWKVKAPAMFIAAAFVVLPTALTQAASWPEPAGQTIFDQNFNSCNWTADAISETSCGFRLGTPPVGTYSVKNGVMTIAVTKAQDGACCHHHTEIEPRVDTFTINRFAIVGEAYWYGARIKLHDWAPEHSWEIIMQWHGMADSGEDIRNPPVALLVRDGRYKLAIRADSKEITPSSDDPNRYTRDEVMDLGPVTPNVWVDWAFNIKWDPFGVDGSIVVWKDGSVIYEEYGQPNTFNDSRGPNWSMGIYKYFSDSTMSSRTLSIDDVRAAKADGGGGGTTSVPPSSPSLLSAQAVSDQSVEVAWKDQSGDEAGFTVERQEAGDSTWESIGATQSDVTSYTDQGLSPSTKYAYRVKAFNGVGTSGPSNALDATTLDGIELRAFGYKKRGYHKVFLSFFGAPNTSMDVIRDDQVVDTTSEDVFLDEIDRRGQASYTFKVCESASPDNCSSKAVVTF